MLMLGILTLGDLGAEMNKRALNLIELNELSGWKFNTT